MNISSIITIFTKKEFLNYCFSLIFLLKLDELLRDKKIFINLCFSTVLISGFRARYFCGAFLVDILPLGSGSEYLRIWI